MSHKALLNKLWTFHEAMTGPDAQTRDISTHRYIPDCWIEAGEEFWGVWDRQQGRFLYAQELIEISEHALLNARLVH